MPSFKYILFQAMPSYLQGEDIYINVGRLVLIPPRGNTKIQTKCNVRIENYEWIC